MQGLDTFFKVLETKVQPVAFIVILVLGYVLWNGHESFRKEYVADRGTMHLRIDQGVARIDQGLVGINDRLDRQDDRFERQASETNARYDRMLEATSYSNRRLD